MFVGYSLISPKLLWHDGLILKLRQNSICGEMIKIFEDFLSNRKQIIVLNSQFLSCVDIHAGVPQGSILGLLLFLIQLHQ